MAPTAILELDDALSNVIAFDCCLSPDGKNVVGAYADGRIRLWDIQSGTVCRVFRGHVGSATAVHFSPDGAFIISGGGYQDPSIKLWYAGSARCHVAPRGEETHSGSMPVGGHMRRQGVSGVPHSRFAESWDGASARIGRDVYSPDDVPPRHRSAGAPGAVPLPPGDPSAPVLVFEAKEEGSKMKGHCNWVNCVRFSHAGRRVATCASDSTAKVWDPTSGALLATLTKHADWVLGCAFSSDDCKLATCSADHTIIIWSMSTYAALLTIYGHEDAVYGVQFLTQAGDTRLLSWSHDCTLKLWQLNPTVPARPEPPQVTDAHKYLVRLRWEPPPANGREISAFHIAHRAAAAKEWSAQCNFPPDVTFGRITDGLKAGGKYSFRVSASNALGQGPWSLPSKLCRCKPDVPGQSCAPHVHVIGATFAIVAWGAPNSMGAPTRRFCLRCRHGFVRASRYPGVVVSWNEAKGNGAITNGVHGAGGQMEAATRSVHALIRDKIDIHVRGKLYLKLLPPTARRQGSAHVAELSALVVGLTPGVMYQFAAIAENKVGIGQWSRPSSSERALSSVPAMAEPPSTSANETHGVTVAWIPPPFNGAILKGFYVRFGCSELVGTLQDATFVAKHLEARSRRHHAAAHPARATKYTGHAGVCLEKEDLVRLKDRLKVCFNVWILVASCTGMLVNDLRFLAEYIACPSSAWKCAQKMLRSVRQYLDGINTFLGRGAMHNGSPVTRIEGPMHPLHVKANFTLSTALPTSHARASVDDCRRGLRALRRWRMGHLALGNMSSSAWEVRTTLHQCRTFMETITELICAVGGTGSLGRNDVTATVSGLAPGRRYMFQVRAENGMGIGDWSLPSDSTHAIVTPPNKLASMRVHDATSALFLNWRELHSTCHGRDVKAYVFSRGAHAATTGNTQFVVWKHGAKMSSFAQQCNYHIVKSSDAGCLSSRAVNDFGVGPPFFSKALE